MSTTTRNRLSKYTGCGSAFMDPPDADLDELLHGVPKPPTAHTAYPDGTRVRWGKAIVRHGIVTGHHDHFVAVVETNGEERGELRYVPAGWVEREP